MNKSDNSYHINHKSCGRNKLENEITAKTVWHHSEDSLTYIMSNYISIYSQLDFFRGNTNIEFEISMKQWIRYVWFQ